MSTSRRIVRAGLATCAAAALVVGVATGPAWAVAPAMTLSSASGPSGGGNPITATVLATAANPTPFPQGNTPTVQFQYIGTGASACSVTAKAVTAIAATGASTTAGAVTVNPETVKWISSTKIGFEVPSASYPAQVEGATSTVNASGVVLAGTQTTAKWSVCVYDSESTTTSTLLATATYTLAVRPQIAKILPASSPSSGGQTITVTGVGFSTATNSTTAAVGGVALTNIKVSANGKSFTGVTAARPAGVNLSLVVSTPGGAVNSTDPDNNGLPEDDSPETTDAPITFAYSNGVVVTPNTAPAGAKVNLDVKGVGFQQLTFNKTDSAAATNATAHIFLVKDAYVPSSNRGVQECKKVLVISNVELMCTLDLTADRLDPATSDTVADTKVSEGAYMVTVVANGSTSATAEEASATIVSSGAAFIVSPY
ncbi:IPT/TIG domain-containing protein [Micromonosporaceae bacterium Da 78-11]